MSDAKPLPVELTLGPTGKDCRVIVGGQDISRRLYKVEVVAEVGELTKVTLYGKVVDVTALGDAWVHYVMMGADRDAPEEAAAHE